MGGGMSLALGQTAIYENIKQHVALCQDVEG